MSKTYLRVSVVEGLVGRTDVFKDVRVVIGLTVVFCEIGFTD